MSKWANVHLVQRRIAPAGDGGLFVRQMSVVVHHLEGRVAEVVFQEQLRATAEKEVGGVSVTTEMGVQARNTSSLS